MSIALTSQEQAELERWLGSKKWFETRPAEVQESLRKVPPIGRYFQNTSPIPHGAIYVPHSYANDGTITMHRFSPRGEYEWTVFGMQPDEFTMLDANRGLDDEFRVPATKEEVEAAREKLMVRLTALGA